MLPGLSGSLVSGYFAERVLPERFGGDMGEAGRERAHAALRRWQRQEAASLGPVSTARGVFDLAAAPVARVLGYSVGAARAASRGEVVVSALHGAGAWSSPILLASAWGEDLDATWREAVRQSLGAGADWCLCTNGVEVRLVDTRRSHSRRHLAFTLDALGGDTSTFGVFWGLCRPEAFAPGGGSGRDDNVLPLIERVVFASALETVAVCRGLRTGVLDALGLLLSALSPARSSGTGRRRSGGSDGRNADPANLLEQALTLVYRVLFLLFAESRELLPTWHPVYRDSYSMEAVRSLAEREGPARGLWETLQAISRLSHAGCHAGDLTVTPFNGRLFSPAATPAGEFRDVDDETARQVVLSLCTSKHGAGGSRVRIAYRDLGVEQLGSVYESVLDYRIVTSQSRPGRGPGLRLEGGAGVRKATGTFYTPQSITTFLVRRTLAPLVANLTPEAVLDLRVVDPAMGSGAFLVAACSYLAGAYESALVRHARCRPGDVGEEDRRSFRRLVASRCLYGVDLNPMAVQLARLSLWLSTLAPDRPLTFLDHRLQAGNSLVGASLDDLARRPDPAGAGRRIDAAAPLLSLLDADGPGPALRAVLPARVRLAAGTDDSLAVVREKEALLASLSAGSSPLAPWKEVADAWCAIGLGVSPADAEAAASPGRRRPVPPGLLGTLADHLHTGRSALPAAVAESWRHAVRTAAASGRFFHWSLEFPEVFYTPTGLPRTDAGFDAVIGNPPWDMLRADNPGAQPDDTGSAGNFVRFARTSGLYRALGDGHVNSFQLFLERGLRLVRPGGRIGMVLPWGVASDAGCAPLRRLLFDTCTLDPLYCFDNANGIFPIHRSVRFLLLGASAGGRTDSLACRIGERDPAVLEQEGGPETVLTRELLRRVSGDGLAIPDIRAPADVALVEKLVSSAPPLSSAEGWGVEFGRELNATDDRRHFTTEPNGIPVVEGKHVQPFRAAVSAAPLRLPLPAASALYARTNAFLRPRLAYRDVASATNRLTLIAAMVPAGAATVHTLFCLRGALRARDQWFLCGVLNSFVANYLVRLRVTTHVTAGILARLPVPRPDHRSPALRRIAALARGLSTSPAPETDDRYPLLQAHVARLYGLTEEELAHVLTRFPLIDDRAKTRTMTSFVDLLIC